MLNNNKLTGNTRPMLLFYTSKLLNNLIIATPIDVFTFIVNSEVVVSSKLCDITEEDIYPIRQYLGPHMTSCGTGYDAACFHFCLVGL